ncbi:MAG: DUF5050 domain-containing protein [Planctomycetota bacterium]|nr:DUF5050 domain-containing protein [Planctomycetota bacterium]
MPTAPVLITFALFTWQGDYASWDEPHGVGQTEHESNIYTIRSDGSGLRKVVGDHHRANNPRFSPDGTRLYFQAKVGANYQIFRCGLDGSDVEDLTSGHAMSKESFGFTFARDGRLVYGSFDGRKTHVATMNADGSDARLLAPELGYCYMANYSPDGKRIVFAHTERNYRLMTADPDGKNLFVLTPDMEECFGPHYTGDGRGIIFIRRDEDIYRVEADGSNIRRLTTGNKYLHYYLTPNDKHGSTDGHSLSPDGRRIAYMATREGKSQLFVMNTDGSGQRQLTRLPTRCSRAKWSADSRQIAFVSFVREPHAQLFIIDDTQGEPAPPRQLTDLPGAVFLMDWMPTVA